MTRRGSRDPETDEPGHAAGRRREAQLQELAAIAVTSASARAVDDILRLVTEKAREIVGAHLAAASLTLDPGGAGPITALSLSDRYAAWRDGARAPDATLLARRVCQENRPLRLTAAELAAHPAWRESGEGDGQRLPLRGWLAAPLAGRDGRSVGLIQLSDKQAGEFTPTDEAILVQLAQIASVAIENARLYAESEARRRQAEALAGMAKTLTARTGIRVLFDHAGLDGRFPPDVETAAYRILQEGLTNVARHAGVREVTVKAWADETILILHVDDAGRGFDPAGLRPSSGLAGMRERAGLLGGHLTVESAPGAGTRVTAELPVDGGGERRPDAPGGEGQ